MAKKKPAKPYPDFPLFAHANGQWAKKIRGKNHYFGTWDQPDEALSLYQRQRDDLYSGRTPRSGEGLTVRDVLNLFLAAKKTQVEAGELAPRTRLDYIETGKFIVEGLGRTTPVESLSPVDFLRLRGVIAKKKNLVSQTNHIIRTRTIFRWAYESELIENPLRFGPDFKPPSKSALRREKQTKEVRFFSAEEINALLTSAKPVWRAMILLGINCGLGNHDCGTMEFRHLDLKGGWLTFPRPKTGIDRRAKLWPETVEAINDYLPTRKPSKDPELSQVVFLSRTGRSWVRQNKQSPLGAQFSLMLANAEINRRGVGFYALRHTFETVASGCRDQVAVNHVMGHADNSMAGVYREWIEDSRLEAVAEHVRQWLFRK